MIFTGKKDLVGFLQAMEDGGWKISPSIKSLKADLWETQNYLSKYISTLTTEDNKLKLSMKFKGREDIIIWLRKEKDINIMKGQEKSLEMKKI